MAFSLFSFFSVVVFAITARAQQNNSGLITLGSSISPSTHPNSWFSPSHLFAFGFFPQGKGFAVGIWLVGKPDTIVWSANRDKPPVSSKATLDLTSDRWLLLRTELGDENLTAIGSEPAVSASMLDSGNFVIYGNGSSVIWESFSFPTDTILGGQNLSSGGLLVSSVSIQNHSSGRFVLAMQTDGNLVAYPFSYPRRTEDAYWASNTYQTSALQLALSTEGWLCLQNSTSCMHNLSSSSHVGKHETIVFRATLDSDGIFRLFAHRFTGKSTSNISIEWSMLNNQCEVKGFCGLNGYCSEMGTKTDCYCYPGFHFVDPENKYLGCYKNFSEYSCESRKDSAMLDKDATLEYIRLEDPPYMVLFLGSSEDCQKTCLEDCNCAVATYLNGTCWKYKLPLRFGRKDSNYSSTAFFMTGLARNNAPPTPQNLTIVTKSRKSMILTFALCLGSFSFLCFSIAAISVFKYRAQACRYKRISQNARLNSTEEFNLRAFSYEELERATDGFKEEVGTGSFGTVYKGTLSAGNKIVAVKRLERVVEGEREFQAEMTAIGQTHHKNLVRLLGFCIEGSHKLLVFGVLLLETACCRRSLEVNASAADRILLSDWVYSCFVAGELDKLAEDEDADLMSLERIVKVGLWCIQDDPNLRPPMKNVILMLEGTVNVPVPPSPRQVI
ncbi:S-locus glycoprotein domain [Dillenia turbinata]|uniref:non-specific serine/threonine protein kinase n=1 Tax=Dillenia turbinata TaxID=194707 RepID=A0AAN8UXY2_9MAGN